MSRRDRQAVWFSLAIGLLATALVLIAYTTGKLDPIELRTYDLRCKYANSIRPDPRLVILAIDDTSLDVIERWPWTRSTQAALISLAAELGAKRIIVDVLWDERERPRRQLTVEEELRFSPQELDGRAATIGYPDKELAAAIAEAGNVYMSFGLSRQSPESLTQAAEFQAAVDAAIADNRAGMQQCVQEMIDRRSKRITPGEETPKDLIERVRLVAHFQRFPTLSAAEAFEETQIEPTPALSDMYDQLRQEALRRLVRQFLSSDAKFAALPWQQQLQQAFQDVTGRSFDAQASLARLLDSALLLVHGERAMDRVCRIAASQPIHALPVEAVLPPHYLLLQQARGAGSVEFQPDVVDGVVRHLPIFARHGKRIFPQLGVAVAMDELNIGVQDIECRPGEIAFQIRGQAEPLVVQVDNHGETLVPWIPSDRKSVPPVDSRRRFPLVPMDALWSLHVTQQNHQRNCDDIAEGLRTLVSSGEFDELTEVQVALDRYDRTKADIRATLLAEQWAEHKAAKAAHRAACANFSPVLAGVTAKLTAIAELLNQESDAPQDDRRRKLVETGSVVLTLDDANKALAADEVALASRLRGLLADKLVFIGYTAAALADAKPIPTAGSAPGVLGHVNLLNGLLTGQLLKWLPTWANLVIAAIAGVVSTFISARMRPRLGLLLIAFLIVAFLSIAGFIAFERYRPWIALTPAVAALFLPYLFISVYRYVFIDSERRHLATTLGQYTSKQIAKLMAEDPELCRKAESREVTAMFTDLRGFTTISERIGAERTQKVLNICLGRFTEVMLQHEAMVNKFIGDGIFAFWNPVIFPQPDHVLKACETALDLQESLITLQSEMKKRGGDDVFSELQLRIGVATGNAIVGPCGSEQKYDYTCIGDSVNLAARLESANKAFGTLILVAGPARSVAGDRFVFRYLGGVQVKGKTNAVPVYELLGRKGAVAADEIAYAERFAAGVAEYQSRRWSEAGNIFQECLRARPHDLAAQAYVDQTRQHEINHPPEKWNGAIELLEK